MPIFLKKTKLFNVRMMIKEEKILSNIYKVKKLINPNSKKQIIKLEEDSYFKDLMESITNFLTEYPSKTAFPSDVYKAAYDLVEYATLQFENNNNQIAKLMNEREENIKASYILKEALDTVSDKQEGWTSRLSRYEGRFDKNISEGLSLIANSQNLEEENIRTAKKMIETKIANLESNLFIEVDIERIEDRSKALSAIGIELADSLKTIPAPVERVAASVAPIEVNNISNYEMDNDISIDDLRSFEDNKQDIKDEIARLTISENQKKIEEEKEKIELQEKLEKIDLSGMYKEDSIDFDNDEIDTLEKEPKHNTKEEKKNDEMEIELAKVVETKAKQNSHVLDLDSMLKEENTKIEEKVEVGAENVSTITDNHNDNIDIHEYETEEEKLIKEATMEVKPSFFKRIWNAITYMFKVKVVLDLPTPTENEES